MLRVCSVDELPEGEVTRLDTVPPIAVFHAESGFFALDDTCTHQDASLAEGYLEGCEVECPLHAACFDLRTGVPNGLPATRPVRTHEVLVQDGTVFVVMAEQGSAA
jgi:3-phenylpropionate/trans-cinnamate dioxygenase ferredoxin subunit